MAVLLEAISVIVRMDALLKRFPGGWAGFKEIVPNRTLCSDGEIARVGFMTPRDTEEFVMEELEPAGLRFLRGKKAIDLAVADQQFGLTTKCDWLECGRVTISPKGPTVAACRLLGSKITKIFTPDGWEYENSLSHTFGFVPAGQLGKAVKFLGHENGKDIYFNPLSGERVYIARTGTNPHRSRSLSLEEHYGKFVEEQLKLNSALDRGGSRLKN